MKTTVIGNGKEEKKDQVKTSVRPSIPNPDKGNTEKVEPNKVGGMPVGTAFDDKPKAKPEAPKAEAGKSEATKAELREGLQAQKAALNLDGTIQLVERLYRRKIQREKLIDTIDVLKAFEVAQLDDADQTDGNAFQKCELAIYDDKGREFKTSNSFIVNMVAKHVNTLCVEKLAEIEAEIYIP